MGILDLFPSEFSRMRGVCMLEVSQIHNSPTPTHHPTNPVNSKNRKYPTREKMRNPVHSSATTFRRGARAQALRRGLREADGGAVAAAAAATRRRHHCGCELVGGHFVLAAVLRRAPRGQGRQEAAQRAPRALGRLGAAYNRAHDHVGGPADPESDTDSDTDPDTDSDTDSDTLHLYRVPRSNSSQLRQD